MPDEWLLNDKIIRTFRNIEMALQKNAGDDENDLSPLRSVTQVKSTCSFYASKRAVRGNVRKWVCHMNCESLSALKVFCNPHGWCLPPRPLKEIV